MRITALVYSFQQHRHTPFDWETNNCGLSVSNVLEGVYGVDYGAKYRPHCKTALSTCRWLKNTGGLIELMKNEHDFKQIPVKMARRGDVVTVQVQGKSNLWSSLGIVIDHRAAFATKDGMEFIPFDRVDTAWRHK